MYSLDFARPTGRSGCKQLDCSLDVELCAAKLVKLVDRRRGPGLRAARLVEHASLLMDTKHFLKDYSRTAGADIILSSSL